MMRSCEGISAVTSQRLASTYLLQLADLLYIGLALEDEWNAVRLSGTTAVTTLVAVPVVASASVRPHTSAATLGPLLEGGSVFGYSYYVQTFNGAAQV
jgi:hypothetical protein